MNLLPLIISMNVTYFKGRNFHGKKVSPISPTAKCSYFAGINFGGIKKKRFYIVIK